MTITGVPTGLAGAWIAAAAFALAAQSTGPHRNADAQKIRNPAARTAESIAAGKKLFMFYCASCHGPSGKGDGGVYGAFGGGSPTNLADDAWQRAMSDGEIFVVVRDGLQVVEMQGFRKRMTDAQLWDVVNYVRSIAEKPASP